MMMANLDQTDAANAKAGEWLVIRDWNLTVRQIDKVTPKFFQLAGARFPSRIGRTDRKIICRAPDEEAAQHLRDSIAGIDGEYNRRRSAADADRRERVEAAEDARQKAIARLLASRVSA
jgi:hypothetical protein